VWNTMANPPIYTKINEWQSVLVKGWISVGVGKLKWVGEGEGVWSMNFICGYENRTMKSIEIVLMVDDEGLIKGVNLIKTHCKHVCKWYIESQLCN
jgi:hypothetical protein